MDRLGNDLADCFAAPEVEEVKLYQALARAAELGYVVTGNGFYLYLKGEITIGGDLPTALPPPAAQSRTGASSKASRRVKGRP